MERWLQLTEEQRKAVINSIAINTGIQEKAIEKDLWVTTVLRALYQTDFREVIFFKGGTSLSKCFDLIQRLSEDIDLAIDRKFLGFETELSRTRIKKLQKAACSFTSNELKDALLSQLLQAGVPQGMISIQAADVPENKPDTDQQQLLISYPGMYDPVEYLQDVVKVEVSARSSIEPYVMMPINSIISNSKAGASYSEQPFVVPVIEPKRTFLEKAFLLHEEFTKGGTIRTLRMSRHLYDLERLMDTEHAKSALGDESLYADVVAHREKFHALKGVDYKTHAGSSINFVPPAAVLKAFEADYASMREQMVYGNAPDFAELMKRITELQQRFRSTRSLAT